MDVGASVGVDEFVDGQLCAEISGQGAEPASEDDGGLHETTKQDTSSYGPQVLPSSHNHRQP